MYISALFLSSGLWMVTAQITYHKNNQGITHMSNYSIPADTERVWFGYNSITRVQAGYFKDLSNLTEIGLQSNDISDIDDCAFSHVPSVTLIKHAWNKLSVIRKNMFSGLPNLAELRIQNNLIHTIEVGSFRQNTALVTLLLWGNLLQTIPELMFDPQNHPSGLSYFEIDGNPLSCDESLCWLKQFDTTWITVVLATSTLCTGPQAVAGWTWQNITTDDLNCNYTSGECHFYLPCQRKRYYYRSCV